MTIRSADEFRVCQFPLPNKPSKVCAEPLHGRGRWKWCASHSEFVRDEQKRLGNSRWQRNWRRKHPAECKKRRWVYRAAEQLLREMLDMFPEAPTTALYARALADFRKLVHGGPITSVNEEARPNEFNWGPINTLRTVNARKDPADKAIIFDDRVPILIPPDLLANMREHVPWIIERLVIMKLWVQRESEFSRSKTSKEMARRRTKTSYVTPSQR